MLVCSVVFYLGGVQVVLDSRADPCVGILVLLMSFRANVKLKKKPCNELKLSIVIIYLDFEIIVQLIELQFKYVKLLV